MIVMTGERMITQIMTREEMIEEMTGERILLNAEWLEENDPEMLDWITDSIYWDRGYDRKPDPSEAIVELQFDEGGVVYYANLEASPNKYPSQNQPPWGEDHWEDWEDIELIPYYNEMQKDSLKKDTEKDEDIIDDTILGIYISIKEDEEINLCLRS
jgi:hypothetical protein